MSENTWKTAEDLAADALVTWLAEQEPLDAYSTEEQMRECVRVVSRALRAAGLAVVPREATEAMVSEAWDAHADGAPCELIANPRQIYEALNAALSAGELAPPDKGEG